MLKLERIGIVPVLYRILFEKLYNIQILRNGSVLFRILFEKYLEIHWYAPTKYLEF